jgi:hypothetical protein
MNRLVTNILKVSFLRGGKVSKKTLNVTLAFGKLSEDIYSCEIERGGVIITIPFTF